MRADGWDVVRIGNEEVLDDVEQWRWPLPSACVLNRSFAKESRPAGALMMSGEEREDR
jgi:hypothetical protein